MTTVTKTAAATVLAKVDDALVASMSSIKLGLIFRAWKGSRGIDYIMIGADPAAKLLYAVKANSINEDGTVNVHVKKHNRVFSYTTSPGSDVAIVRGVTSIIGNKSKLNINALNEFNKKTTKASTTGFKGLRIVANVAHDARKTTIYP